MSSRQTDRRASLSANLKEITENQADADRAIRDMATGLKSRQFDTLQALEYSARIMAFQGHESGLAGQITARTEEPGRYWTLRLGLGFEEASANGSIVVDDDNQCVRGQGMANPTTRFHLWVYRARPDIQCIVHTHPPYVSALATLGAPPGHRAHGRHAVLRRRRASGAARKGADAQRQYCRCEFRLLGATGRSGGAIVSFRSTLR
jgi:Class II Aldolase and Adducin N-terminal domain